MNKLNSTLMDLYFSHEGKLSQKFMSYLITYDRLFAHRLSSIKSMLEIGVQNGGSLDIWAKYFSQADRIIGVDINQACSSLIFEDERINCVIGNALNQDTFNEIIRISPALDLVIDDGSHFPHDIIGGFLSYFPLISEGGVYIVEDMHASYWESYGGGLHNQKAAHSFFKILTDALQINHYRPDDDVGKLFQTWLQSDTMTNFIRQHKIYSISFYDSLVVIEKASSKYPSGLGDTIYAGRDARIEPSLLNNI